MGSLTATGGGSGAGIGCYNGADNDRTIDSGVAGTMAITAGKVAAVGGDFAAGIGSGTEVAGGNVSISGGKLNPTGITTRAEFAQLLYNLLSK